MTAAVPYGETLDEPVEALEVRRSTGVFATATVASVVLGGLYAIRAVGSGSAAAATTAALLVVLAVAAALGWWDARTPLLVADPHGVRLRQRRRWTGVPWSEVTEVVLTHPRSLGRDGSIEVVAGDTGYLVPLGLATSCGVDDLAPLVRALVADAAPVRERSSATPAPATPTTTTAPADPPPADPPPPEPDVRTATRRVSRSERQAQRGGDLGGGGVGSGRWAGPVSVGTAALKHDPTREVLPEARELRGFDGRPDLVFDPLPEAVRTVAHGAAPIEVAPTHGPERPVIGPQLANARASRGLSTDQLSDRTRIRPHVIEAIEVDDFVPCGGDFYARGHLRSLALVLGIDGEDLVRTYDALYARGPIAVRQVFSAELASGPSPAIRRTRGGPNWSALLGVVLVLAIIWGIGRFVAGGADAPAVAPTVAPTSVAAPATTVAPAAAAPTSNQLVLRGLTGTTRVVVRDDAGTVVWRGALVAGQTHHVTVAGTAHVVATRGDAVSVRVDGTPHGRVGPDSARATAVLGRP